MLRNYNLYLRRLNLIFEKKISDAVRNFDKFNKKIVSEHMIDIYKRWFYSASQDNCSITPANIFASISNGENIFSRVKEVYGNKITSEPVFYSLDDHPVVNDLRIIIKNFVYIYDLQIEFDPENKDVKEILSMISIHETGYLDYLKTYIDEEYAKEITILELLNHTSGLQSFGPNRINKQGEMSYSNYGFALLL